MTSVSAEPPTLALVGSGEYLEAMAPLEAQLIGAGRRYVQIPLAAGREGDERFSYWVELGREQARRLGVEAVPILARSRADALDPTWAELVAEADLIYLSGGDPLHLAASLRDTPLWAAIVAALARGVPVAGCSAGAMVLGGVIGSLRRRAASAAPGLGILPGTAILPHFDRLRHWHAGHAIAPVPGATRTIGIDELTALVGTGGSFHVWGAGSAWLVSDGRLERLESASLAVDATAST